MNRVLPTFTYHPDPISTGNVEASDTVCRCCGKSQRYIYTGSVYCVEDLRDRLCPWCIADGSAAERFDAEFADADPLIEAGLPSNIVEEVNRRTPGYSSWQQEVWQTCCHDACEFHGDAKRGELEELAGAPLDRFLTENQIKPADWVHIVKHYQPGGGISVFRFVCRHCKEPRYGLDLS